MKSALLCACLAAALYAQAPVRTPQVPGSTEAEQPCSLEGRVVDATSSEPLRNASVSLQPVIGGGAVASVAGAAARTYATVSDASGKFTLRGIAAGTYRLTAKRTGYLSTEYGSRIAGRAGVPLSLKAGQAMSDLQLRVRRGGVISGKVVDEFGEPMERVQVSAQKYRFMGNERQLTTQTSATTDDQGNYRLFGIEPGRYFLRASPDGTVLLMNNDVQQYAFVYAPVYYPGAQDERAASQVEVTAGSMQVGMNFTLSKTRSFRVRGVVQNATGSRGTIMAYIRQRNAGSPIMGGTYRIFNVGAKNEVDVQGLGPGPYTLSAAMSAAGRNYGGRIDLDLSEQDLDGVVVPLTTGIDLPGEIRTEEGDTLDLTSISVLLNGSSTMSLMGSSGTFVFGTRSESKVGEDGKFVLRDVFPDASSRPVVNGLPQGFYVKAIRLGDQEVLESGIDFSSGAAGAMVITLSGKAATVEGSVMDGKNQPLAGATVVLVPKSEKRRGVSQFYRNASTDQQGRFVIRGVQPSDYTVYAWEDVESGQWLDAEFMRPFRGESLEVAPGGQHSLQLKAITAAQ